MDKKERFTIHLIGRTGSGISEIGLVFAASSTQNRTVHIDVNAVLNMHFSQNPTFREIYGKQVASGKALPSRTIHLLLAEAIADAIHRRPDIDLIVTSGFLQDEKQVELAIEEGLVGKHSITLWFEANKRTCAERAQNLDRNILREHHKYHDSHYLEAIGALEASGQCVETIHANEKLKPNVLEEVRKYTNAAANMWQPLSTATLKPGHSHDEFMGAYKKVKPLSQMAFSA